MTTPSTAAEQGSEETRTALSGIATAAPQVLLALGRTLSQEAAIPQQREET